MATEGSTVEDLAVLEKLSNITYANPFAPARVEFERDLLGDEYDETEIARNLRQVSYDQRANVTRILAVAEQVIERTRRRLLEPGPVDDRELSLYVDAVLLQLYYRYATRLSDHLRAETASPGSSPEVGCYAEFTRDVEAFLRIPGRTLPDVPDPPHLFANFYQIRRAFHHIHQHIAGLSPSVGRLRASVWQSVFTHDMRRYRRVLYRRMGDYTTLITGPSGSGKELVARAVGLSRYAPFDPKTATFSSHATEHFHAVNLSALPATLIESALFGHKKGSFTGASDHHRGYLSVCPTGGTVFLDEIGDVDPEIQVKLLRLLQTRTFQAVGDTQSQEFTGKLIAATNRDLATAVQEGALRQDFYYRLCADRIHTPDLATRLREDPEELDMLLGFIASRMLGPEEGPVLASEVSRWIRNNLGDDYTWPGNVRELEQCAQNIMIRNRYDPIAQPMRDAPDEFLASIRDRALTADELLSAYCTWVYAEYRSYTEVARRLGLDRRTVKARIDPERLADFEG